MFFFSLQLIYYIKKRERTGAMNSMEIHTLIFLLWGFCTYVRLLQQEKRVPGKRKPIYGRMSDSQGKKIIKSNSLFCFDLVYSTFNLKSRVGNYIKDA